MAGLMNTFRFGVELEFLLGSKKTTYKSWKSLAQDVNKKLYKAGLASHIAEGKSKSGPETYAEWTIVQEVTIPSQPGKNLWGIELVSPIYLAEPTFSWAADLSTIFAVLHASFLISPSLHCSTHVHLSGYPAPLSGAELAALAKAALYHERALDSLVPPGRRGGWSSSSSSSPSSSSSSSASSASSSSYWCQSNRANPSLASLPLATCLSVIDNAAAFDDGIVADGRGGGGIASVVQTMNLFPAASAYARAHGKTADFVRGKVYKWNMEGMMSGGGGGKGLGTVEFRQPPGSLTAEDAAGWVMLAVSFAAGALVVGPGLDLGTSMTGMTGMTGVTGMVGVEAMGAEEGGSMEELWALLGTGAGSLGWEGLGPVEGIFARRGGF